MKLDAIIEPSATITLTLTELKTVSDAHGWAITGLDTSVHPLPDVECTMQKHDSLKMCVDTLIADMEEM